MSRRIDVFMQLSLDGYFADARNQMDFAHQAGDDPEYQEFTTSNAKGGGMLLFGRRTYEMMVSFWPTPAAAEAMPEVARQMNELPKIVASRTLASADWNNTTITRDLLGTVRQLKGESGPDITILGSGSIVTQLAGEGLLDTIQVVINPIALGEGKSFLAGLQQPLKLERTESRTFRNGCIVATYAPKT